MKEKVYDIYLFTLWSILILFLLVGLILFDWNLMLIDCLCLAKIVVVIVDDILHWIKQMIQMDTSIL